MITDRVCGKMRNVVVILLIGLIGSYAIAQPTPTERRGFAFGTFSSLHYVEEAGDVLGIEITIIPQYKTAYAIFQCAEGAPTDPVFVPVSLSGNQVKFTIRSGDASCDGVYTGTITAKGMQLMAHREGAGKAAYNAGFLSRGRSYWAR